MSSGACVILACSRQSLGSFSSTLLPRTEVAPPLQRFYQPPELTRCCNVRQSSSRMSGMASCPSLAPRQGSPRRPRSGDTEEVQMWARHSPMQYMDNVRECLKVRWPFPGPDLPDH